MGARFAGALCLAGRRVVYLASSKATRGAVPALGAMRPGLSMWPLGGHRRFSRALGGHSKVSAGKRTISVASAEATRRVELPNIWLRDNCRCSSCVNQDTSQRNFDTFQIPADIRASEVTADDKGLHVVWSNDGHRSFFSWAFIRFYQSHDHRSPEPVDFHYWGQSIAADPPTVPYKAVMDTESEAGIGSLTSLIRRFGFAFVDGTPTADPESTERLLERIAFIRVTHYGGFYDFIPDLALADTAYTNLALPAHTDTTYFTEPAGLQAFHLLMHRGPTKAPVDDADAEPEQLGGQSLLVDGFHAARILLEEDPAAFDVLSRVRLPWHASGNKGITISPDRRYPVLELVDDKDQEVAGGAGSDSGAGAGASQRLGNGIRLHRVRWNNDDRGVVPFGADADGIDPQQWYDAARKWTEILQRPNVEYWTQLTPGKTLIFDNWRVLHGRSAFVGIRRICGGYTARDDFISRWRNTNYPREKVLQQVMG